MDSENEYGYGGSSDGRPDSVDDGRGDVTAPRTENPGDGGQSKKQSSMALASLIMGILSIVTSCCCYGGFIFGGLGIIFALLSRTKEKLEGYALGGLITSIIGMVLGVAAFFVLMVGGLLSIAGEGGGY